jgi:hypothetical protein
MKQTSFLSFRRYLTILIAVGLVGVFIPQAAISQERQEKVLRTLTVTGEGKVSIPTTISQIYLAVEIQGKTATEVQNQIAQKTSSLIQLLKSRNVEKLQTTGISLQPLYDYNNNQRKFLGYLGVNSISFRILTEQAGAILDDSIKAGATRIDSISFTASDNAVTAAQTEALTRATKNAQQQADAVLATLNLTRKEIVGIQLNGANAPQPQILQQFDSVAKSAAVNTSVIGSEQTVGASVTLQISY